MGGRRVGRRLAAAVSLVATAAGITRQSWAQARIDPAVQLYWRALGLATVNLPASVVLDTTVRRWPPENMTVAWGRELEWGDVVFTRVRYHPLLLDTPPLTRLPVLGYLRDLAGARDRDTLLRTIVDLEPAHTPTADTMVARVYLLPEVADSVIDILVELHAFGTSVSQTGLRYYPRRNQWLSPYLWQRGGPFNWTKW